MVSEDTLLIPVFLYILAMGNHSSQSDTELVGYLFVDFPCATRDNTSISLSDRIFLSDRGMAGICSP